MKKTSIQLATLGAAMIMLGGCASPLDRLLEQEISSDPVTEVKTCLDKTKTIQGENVEKQRNSVDQFLNCFFKVDVPSGNLEWRLVRGHAVVAMISMYGAYSLKHDPVNQTEDARRLFERIFEAEKSLWSASSLKTGGTAVPMSDEFKMLVKDAARHDRIIDVGQVATASLKPAKRRLLGFFEKISALFAAPTPTGVIGALRDVRKAARRAFVVALKGSDYINGARIWMKNIEIAKKGKPDVVDWKAIDKAYLTPACEKIAFMAYDEVRPCIPTRP